MNPGALNRRVTIQRVKRTPDGYGGYTETLADVATVWAKVTPLTGHEQLLAMQTEMQRPHRFEIRHREDVTGATRLLYDGRVFDVTSVVDPGEKHRRLEIMAEEVVE